MFAHWQNTLAEWLSMAEQNRQTWPPPDRKKFWQEGLEFWQDRMVGPPLKMTQLRLCWLGIYAGKLDMHEGPILQHYIHKVLSLS